MLPGRRAGKVGKPGGAQPQSPLFLRSGHLQEVVSQGTKLTILTALQICRYSVHILIGHLVCYKLICLRFSFWTMTS